MGYSDNPYNDVFKDTDNVNDSWSRLGDNGASAPPTSANGEYDHADISADRKDAWISSFQQLGDTTSLSLYELWKATTSQLEHLLEDRCHMSESFTESQYSELGELNSMLLRLRYGEMKSKARLDFKSSRRMLLLCQKQYELPCRISLQL